MSIAAWAGGPSSLRRILILMRGAYNLQERKKNACTPCAFDELAIGSDSSSSFASDCTDSAERLQNDTDHGIKQNGIM